MKNFKYLFAVCTSLILLVGCKKDLFEDVAFLDGVSASAKLSALYNITQDNTGLVTIIPIGEGVSSFDIYYGDGTVLKTIMRSNVGLWMLKYGEVKGKWHLNDCPDIHEVIESLK
jgi:hypothetical protein